jgi:hypothetical protein
MQVGTGAALELSRCPLDAARQAARAASTMFAMSAMSAMGAMLGRLVAQLKMPRLDEY